MEYNSRAMKIIWAVDVPDMESLIQESIISSLKNLAHYWEIEIQLVYVLNEKDIDLPFDYSSYQLLEFERKIRGDLTNGEALTYWPKFIPCKIVSQSSTSLKEAMMLPAPASTAAL